MAATAHSPDVSIIVTAGREGALAHRSMRGVWSAVRQAETRGIGCEVLVVLDRPDLATAAYFRAHQAAAVLLQAGLGDVGLARNFGVRHAAGRHVAFLDAAVLCGPHWIARAWAHADARSDPCVCHPSVTIRFEDGNIVRRHIASADPDFSAGHLFEHNPWTAAFLARRDLLLRHPYQPCPAGSGFAGPDWHWYCDVLAAGVAVHTVARTCVFVRGPVDGGPNEALLRPTGLFAPAALVQRQQPAAPAQAGRRRPTRPAALPAWLRDEWRAVHAVEPQIFPDAKPPAAISSALPPAPLGHAYLDFCRDVPGPVSHVFLVGEVNHVALHYVRALVEHQWAREVLVLATEGASFHWARLLPPEAMFMNFGKRYRHLRSDQQRRFLAQLLVQQAPDVVHNIDSPLGYEVFAAHGKALAEVARLYCSISREDITPEGQTAGLAFVQLPRCFEHLTAVLTDHQAIGARLQEVFAFDPAKLIKHYQPCQQGQLRRRPIREGQNEPINILWAGRNDPQDRPDVLARIARRCRSLPVHFHVHASAEAGRRSPLNGPNITLHADETEALPAEDYDVVLRTSQRDGLAAVLIEALAARLHVIAAAARGISELVRPGQTGYLVDRCDDVDSYVRLLKRVLERRPELATLVKNGWHLVRRRHSWEAFVREVGWLPGYAVPKQLQEVTSLRRAA